MTETISSHIPFADPTWHQDKSHPYYKNSHRNLQKFLRKYVDSEIAPNVAQWEKQGFVPKENFEKHASLGMLAAAVFPLPLDQLEGITLPGGINPQG
jgi:Acyl-CoA dehydrogenase, N-terminal domain